MIDVIHAIDLLKNSIKQQDDYMEMDFYKCDGMVSYEDIFSTINVPEFPKSAMDGYAVISDDTIGASKNNPKILKVVGNVLAGDCIEIEPVKGTAIKIMTGGMIPKGYDSVVMQENTDYGETYLNVYVESSVGQNYCPIGEDVTKGSLLIEKGTLLNANHIGILASAGIDTIKVIKPLKVGILATGSELLQPGEELIPGKIYGSSCYTLRAIVEKNGFDISYFNICEDDFISLKNEIIKASNSSDILITTGGVSVGVKDLIPDIVEELDGNVIFRRLAMKPGTPAMASKINNAIVISFSGNPFATLANFEVMFWPIVGSYYNCDSFYKDELVGELIQGKMKPGKLRRYVRAIENNGKITMTYDVHKSSVISNLVNCNCLVIQEPNSALEKGDKVKYIRLS